MKALVIGASGFVGYYLINELLSQKYDVTATKLPNEKLDVTCKFIDLDITSYTSIIQCLVEEKPNIIFHLAAQSSVAQSWNKPQLTININVIGTLNILEAVKKVNKDIKILLIGSSEEYGKVDYSKPVDEDVPLNPQNIYAISKMTCEQLARVYCDAYAMNIIMTRSFNHIGPRQLPQFVVADFCYQTANIEKEKQNPKIKVGNLNSYRDFTDVRDVVKAYVLLSKYGISRNVYNVGSGKSIKIMDILNLILKKSTKKIVIEVDQNKFRPIDTPRIDVNNSKLINLGWKKTISLEQSIDDMLNYFRNSD